MAKACPLPKRIVGFTHIANVWFQKPQLASWERVWLVELHNGLENSCKIIITSLGRAVAAERPATTFRLSLMKKDQVLTMSTQHKTLNMALLM